MKMSDSMLWRSPDGRVKSEADIRFDGTDTTGWVRVPPPAMKDPYDDYLRHELRAIERAVTALGVVLHFRDDGSFARASLTVQNETPLTAETGNSAAESAPIVDTIGEAQDIALAHLRRKWNR
jgi:hypothetical protein